MSLRRADQIGGELQHRVLVEVGRQTIFRQFNAIAQDTRETDFEVIAFRSHGSDVDGLTRPLRRGDHWFGREVERNTQDIGIFHIEQVVFIEVVRLAAQRAPNDLFAEELRAKGANAQHMRDCIGVPAFGEHGDGDDAAD